MTTVKKRLFLKLLCGLGFESAFALSFDKDNHEKHLLIFDTLPKFYGFNLGENPYGSNVGMWIRYYHMNSARFFWPFDLWPKYRFPRNALIVSEQTYKSCTEYIRQNPYQYISDEYFNRVNSYFEGTCADHQSKAGLRELKELELDVIVALTVPTQEFKICAEDDRLSWSEQLRYWQGIYLVSYYLAVNFGFCKYQLFNEPNHVNSIRLTQAEFLKKMQVGSDAIRCALNDASIKLKRELKSEISAPVSAGILNFKPAIVGDVRDRTIGWGELILKSKWTPFEGKIAKDFPLFDTYAVQYYSKQHLDVIEKLSTLKSQIRESNQNQEIPLVVSEMNVATHNQMLRSSQSMDSTEYFSKFGSVLSSYVLSDINQLLIFKFTQTNNLPNGELKRNGLHLVDYSSKEKNISRNTKAAEVARLVFMTLQGDRLLISFDLKISETLTIFGSLSQNRKNFFIFISNESPSFQHLELPIIDLLNNSSYVIEKSEVSETMHGAVTELTVHGNLKSKFDVGVVGNSCTLVKFFEISPAQNDAYLKESNLQSLDEQWLLDSRSEKRLYWLKITSKFESSGKNIYRVVGYNSRSEMLILGHVVNHGGRVHQWISINESELERIMIVSNDVDQINKSSLFEMTLQSS